MGHKIFVVHANIHIKSIKLRIKLVKAVLAKVLLVLLAVPVDINLVSIKLLYRQKRKDKLKGVLLIQLIAVLQVMLQCLMEQTDIKQKCKNIINNIHKIMYL